MSSISGIQSNTSLTMEIRVDFTEKLPTVLLKQEIIPKLDLQSMQAACSVCKKLKNVIVEKAKEKEQALIEKLVKFLRGNLDKEIYADQIKKLDEIIKNIELLKIENLKKLKIVYTNLRDQIFDILTSIKKQDLETLEERFEKENTPLFFEDLFNLAIKAVEFYNTSYTKVEGEIAKGKMSKLLAEKGYFKIALAIAKSQYSKDTTLQYLSERMAEKYYFDGACEVAEAISTQHIKAQAFRAVSEIQAKKGYFKNAIQTANKLRDDDKDDSLLNISKEAIKQGYLDDAHNTALMIPNEYCKGIALRILAEALINKDKFGLAFDVVSIIKDQSAFIEAGQFLPALLVERNHPDKALEMRVHLKQCFDKYVEHVLFRKC